LSCGVSSASMPVASSRVRNRWNCRSSRSGVARASIPAEILAYARAAFPNAAAQTRIVSKARIRLDSGKSVRSFFPPRSRSLGFLSRDVVALVGALSLGDSGWRKDMWPYTCTPSIAGWRTCRLRPLREPRSRVSGMRAAPSLGTWMNTRNGTRSLGAKGAQLVAVPVCAGTTGCTPLADRGARVPLAGPRARG
jgi:hypothetical protein